MTLANTDSGDPLDRLSRFAAELTWAVIPHAARERAQLALRDTVGTIFGGAATTAARIATQAAVMYPGATPILGATVFSAAPLAAFASAVSASALDFDDGHYLGGGIHPGSVIVSSLLTAASSLRVTTAEILTAQVAGYEIALRAAHLLWPGHDTDDYHCTGTAATLGAAAAVTKLRGGDAERISRSIAIAWAHAPMSTFQLPMVKESIGWSAASACFAADLAATGFMAPRVTGCSTIGQILPPTPFHRPGAMSDPFIASLGEVFECSNTYFKPYAACRYTHAAARALADLIATHALVPADLVAIEVHTHRGALFLDDQRPPTLEHGQYSFPFVLSAIVCDGAAGHEQINDAELANPVRLAEAAKITVHHDPQMDSLYPQHYAARIVLRTSDGRCINADRMLSPGDLDDPMSSDELAAKFVAMCTPHLGDATTELSYLLVAPDRVHEYDLVARLTSQAVAS